jgi:hypothetical protein
VSSIGDALQIALAHPTGRINVRGGNEWDANLDEANKAKADALVDALAARARVVEISHRDRGA